MIPKRKTPQANEERGTVKAKYARFFWPVLLGMVMVVSLCAFIPALAGLLYEGRWEPCWGWGVYVLASFTLAWMIPTLPASEGEKTTRQFRLPEWSLFSYFFIIGLGLNWACAFLWFSRRYAFFSTPVIAVTGLIMAFCAVIALLVAWFESSFNNADLTGANWRTALLVFVFAPGVLASIVLRLGLLR
jgi:hypothetical protein